MTEMPKSQELTAPGPPAETAPAIVPGFRSNGSLPAIDRSRDGVAGHTADTGPAQGIFFVPDLIQLEVGRGGRVVVVSDLHLWPPPDAVGPAIACLIGVCCCSSTATSGSAHQASAGSSAG